MVKKCITMSGFNTLHKTFDFLGIVLHWNQPSLFLLYGIKLLDYTVCKI